MYRFGIVNILMAAFLSLPCINHAWAQDVAWVEAEGMATVIDEDKEKARQAAIEVAERNAVAEALAQGITVDTLIVNLRLSGTILGVIPHGKVISREILDEGLVAPVEENTDGAKARYRVRIKAGVAQEIGAENSSFSIDAATNKTIYNDGDELEIRVRSSRDCYIAIFNLLEDDKVTRLLPNYLSGTTFVAADKQFVFPSRSDHKKGVRLRVHLPENVVRITESIYILALPDPVKLDYINAQEGFFGEFDGQTAFIQDVIGAVVSIPMENRAEAFIQYTIQKAREK